MISIGARICPPGSGVTGTRPDLDGSTDWYCDRQSDSPWLFGARLTRACSPSATCTCARCRLQDPTTRR